MRLTVRDAATARRFQEAAAECRNINILGGLFQVFSMEAKSSLVTYFNGPLELIVDLVEVMSAQTQERERKNP